jgi:hypothetical protein
VKIGGYNDKLAVLLDAILARMKHFTVREERFAVVRDKFEQFFLNWDKQQPFAWCKRLATELLQVGAPHCTCSLLWHQRRIPVVSFHTGTPDRRFTTPHDRHSSECVRSLGEERVTTQLYVSMSHASAFTVHLHVGTVNFTL